MAVYQGARQRDRSSCRAGRRVDGGAPRRSPHAAASSRRGPPSARAGARRGSPSCWPRSSSRSPPRSSRCPRTSACPRPATSWTGSPPSSSASTPGPSDLHNELNRLGKAPAIRKQAIDAGLGPLPEPARRPGPLEAPSIDAGPDRFSRPRAPAARRLRGGGGRASACASPTGRCVRRDELVGDGGPAVVDALRDPVRPRLDLRPDRHRRARDAASSATGWRPTPSC